MADNQAVKKEDVGLGITNNAFELIILAGILTFVFIISFFFNVFGFLVKFFEGNPAALNFVDEIIVALLILSIGFALISWHRLQELKKETAERMRLQAKIIEDYEIKLETEKIICKGLHCDIEEYRKMEKDALSRRQKVRQQNPENTSDIQ
ncbi:MAG: hypothetical protein PHE30_02335 [Candidatus Omnitrophica bacterium]|nr:hypothetical protein [Candidatus Omnitrophota bacterium]MDD5026971.1 hypothetical protein [Candidatus Omnitrophota bacterium]MDD5661649.1 hypothetical protein [Candidatus Omnitrophota bacterium]